VSALLLRRVDVEPTTTLKMVSSELVAMESVPHGVEMLDREEVQVHESIDAVGKTCFLALVQLATAYIAGEAFGPAHLRELVCFCRMIISIVLWPPYIS
jgi:hypothetical protein